MNIDPNDFEKNLDSQDENLKDGIDIEKKFFEEDAKIKNENFNQESLDYKKEITDLENKFRFDNSLKMNIDLD